MTPSLFDFQSIAIDKPIRLIEVFGGIGSQAMALRDIGADFTRHRLVEFDARAVACYNAIHHTNFKAQDIRSIHAQDLGITGKDKYCYILFYSFPCQDLSVANVQKSQGLRGLRSGLLFEVERIMREMARGELPQVLVMENVPQVLGAANAPLFEGWLAFLRSRGYQNFTQVLNAIDYGLPQSRARAFCVSALADEPIAFDFPEPVPLTSAMRDYIDFSVRKEYRRNTPDEAVFKRREGKNGILWAGGYPQGFYSLRRIIDIGGACPTITASTDTSFKCFVDGRVRYLTAREAWRLMGFSDADYDAAAGVCRAQAKLWALAGNSIALPVLKAIFLKMLRPCQTHEDAL